jgi:cellulose synthase/poly-beta-1,6-N-acetylglucosamine synthase-like glycosyltransferase
MLLAPPAEAADALEPEFAESDDGLPTVDVIVAFHNESRLLPGKLANLLRLDYPRHLLRFILVDGHSTDGSVKAVEEMARRDERFIVLRATAANKTQQINLALTRCMAEWVVLTDADAHLPRFTLRKLIAVTTDPRVVVAGVLHRPGPAMRLDRVHWRAWNASRRIEYRVGSTSAALGPCYMIRSGWLARLPADVVADDMYISFAALVSGRRIALAETLVTERRAPSSTLAVWYHKLRKARAFLREVLRFLPGALRMRSPMRELFLWRAAATTVAPLIILGTVACGLAIAPKAVAALSIFALACCFTPAEMLAPWRWWRWLVAAASHVGLALVLAGVLCVALASLPFFPQQASFSRWRQEEM